MNVMGCDRLNQKVRVASQKGICSEQLLTSSRSVRLRSLELRSLHLRILHSTGLKLLTMASFCSTDVAQGTFNKLLPHQSINENSHTTIVAIHRAFTDRNDWELVLPHLPGYHLLLPDNPGHGRSSHPSFSIKSAAEHTARLIAAGAIGGRVHAVGHSLGASIAIQLAIKHPDVVLSTFVSDSSDMPLSRAPLLPYLLWTSNRIENAVPCPVIHWLMDGTDLRRTTGSSMSLCTDIAHAEEFELQL